MSECRVFSLEPIRTDGWFERIGETVGSFETLCEIMGESFFAFSLITGARITTLNVDRGSPRSSVVEFEVGGAGGDAVQTQRLSLDRFRQRLVAALISDETPAPAPERETDTEAIQMHVGVRYLLLAPLFGYVLVSLSCFPTYSQVLVARDGVEREFELDDFQQALRAHVLEELERLQSDAPEGGEGIDLSHIPRAEKAAAEGRHDLVVEILGRWAPPLSILLRTPDGRALDAETRGLLADALGLLGAALGSLHDAEQAEEVMRLAIQYAIDTTRGPVAYAQLGRFLLSSARAGEAIAPLRRAASLGAEPGDVWPQLSVAYLERGRLLAAFAAVKYAQSLGVGDPRLAAVRSQVISRLPAVTRWVAQVEPKA